MPQTAYIAAACVFATIGWGAFAVVAKQSPGINEDLLVEGVGGNDRIPDTSAMYDHPQYLWRQGYDYMRADLFGLAPVVSPDAPPPEEVSATRMAQAQNLFARSLQYDPSNAYIWAFYAENLLSTNDVVRAKLALERAWELAPTTEQIARRRMLMVLVTRQVSEDPTAYEAMLRSDTAVIESR